MAETTPPATPPSTEDKDKLTAGALRKFIREEIVNLLPGKSTQDTGTPAAPGTAQPGDIKSEVAEALRQLKSKEDRQARDTEVDKLLAERKANAAKPEVPPVEQRRVHKLMGWGE